MDNPQVVAILMWSLVIILGLSLGSFTNVLIYRLPRDRSVFRPRSGCPSCEKTLRWYHNVPLVSWLVLRGRCAWCEARIGWVYPVVEVACAVLFVAFYARYGFSVTTLGFWYFAVTLLAAFFIDLEHRIIPNALTYPAVVVGIGLALVSPHLLWWESLVGAVSGVAVFVGIAWLGQLLFRKDSMGGGDIKLAAVLGAFLGGGKLLLVFILSAAIGLVISGIAMIVSPALRRDRMIPFGPFLAIAAIVAVFYGDSIIAFYIRNFVR